MLSLLVLPNIEKKLNETSRQEGSRWQSA
jgi:hypothetical protein